MVFVFLSCSFFNFYSYSSQYECVCICVFRWVSDITVVILSDLFSLSLCTCLGVYAGAFACMFLCYAFGNNVKPTFLRGFSLHCTCNTNTHTQNKWTHICLTLSIFTLKYQLNLKHTATGLCLHIGYNRKLETFLCFVLFLALGEVLVFISTYYIV